MTVALFTDADVFAGTERHMLDLAVGLRDCGVTARIACPQPSPLADRATAAGIDVNRIPKRGLMDWRAVRDLRTLLQTGDVSLLHAHNGRTAMLSAAAVAAAGVGRWVMTQHFLQPTRVSRGGVKGILSRAAHGWVNNQVGHVIAISEATRRGVLSRNDVPANRVTVVPNGIADPEGASLSAPATVRSELGIDGGAPLILCVARLEPEKDVQSLVEAMAEVSKADSRAVCVIAGDGSRRAALETRIAALGLQRSVRLLGFRPDALALSRASDVFVLPSLAEPFGLVLLEAMAFGKPVVATRAGGPPEIVVDESTGLLVPPGEPSSLGAAIIRLLADPGARRTMGEAGRERFLRHYTASRMARETADVYRRVLQRQAPAAVTTT